MTDVNIAAGASFGYLRGYGDGDYALARTTSDYRSTSAIYIGQRLASGYLYYIYRGFLQFDTSAIGADSIVNQVNLRMVATTDNSATDYDVLIVKYNWSSQDPLTEANREAAYDGCLAAAVDDNIWRNTAGMSVNTQYTSGNLSTAWVNKTGITYYVVGSKKDWDATAPTGDERVIIAPPNHATEAYRPALVITYTEAATGTLLKVNFYAQMQNLSGGM